MKISKETERLIGAVIGTFSVTFAVMMLILG